MTQAKHRYGTLGNMPSPTGQSHNDPIDTGQY